MKIHIKNIIPLPLKNQARESGVWGQDLFLEEGEWVQVLAPSARGKTSLLSFLYGLRKDYEGEIFFNETELRNLTPGQWALYRQEELGIIFQDLRLFDSFTALENIRIKASLRSYEETHDEMARLLGIEGALEKKVNTLSWGERQRVAIIRALTQPFKWLFLDEPFSHLDRENRHEVKKLLRRECEKRGAGLILTSLDPEKEMEFHRTLEV